MSDQDDDIFEVPEEPAEENEPDNFFIDILTGEQGKTPHQRSW